MFGGSTGELTLIFILALLLFGPERLPVIARNLGKLIRGSKLMFQSLWSELEEEIDRDELRRARDKHKDPEPAMPQSEAEESPGPQEDTDDHH